MFHTLILNYDNVSTMAFPTRISIGINSTSRHFRYGLPYSEEGKQLDSHLGRQTNINISNYMEIILYRVISTDLFIGFVIWPLNHYYSALLQTEFLSRKFYFLTGGITQCYLDFILISLPNIYLFGLIYLHNWFSTMFFKYYIYK